MSVAVTAAKILIADDMASTRQVLDLLLREAGYQTVLAKNGHDAIALFHSDRPDLVILDVIMAGMDGYDVARAIKSSLQQHFIPIIFLTVMDDERTLASCLAAGGDDFMAKPVSPVVLRAKIEALLRQRHLFNTVKAQNDELRRRDEQAQQEKIVAKKVFDTLVSGGCLHLPTIRSRVSSASLFNGDIMLAAAKPSGSLNVMLGDLAGTGLSAAIGSLPVSEVFYSMTRKGFSIVDIAAEINKKLKVRLPSDMSLAACFLELDAVEQSLTVWNGGLPSVYLYSREAMDVRMSFPSSHPRLGTEEDAAFDRHVEVVSIAEGDSVVMLTDSLLQACNAVGEPFGAQRVEDCLRYCYDPDRLVDRLVDAVTKYRGENSVIDDMSLLMVTADSQVQQVLGRSSAADRAPTSATAGAWKASLSFYADTLRCTDPVPVVQQVLLDLQGDEQYLKDVAVVARELIANALEHGLLRLDSALKATPAGFAEYYTQRNERLAQLQEGHICVEIAHQPDTDAEGGVLILRVADSGPGFRRGASSEASGLGQAKGISLVERLTHRLAYNDLGNAVEAEMRWRRSAP